VTDSNPATSISSQPSGLHEALSCSVSKCPGALVSTPLPSTLVPAATGLLVTPSPVELKGKNLHTPHSASGSAAPVLKKPRRESLVQLVEMKLPETPIPAASSSGRPARQRMRPLEHWRNEQVIYERVKGSVGLTVASVLVAHTPAHQNNEVNSASKLQGASKRRRSSGAQRRSLTAAESQHDLHDEAPLQDARCEAPLQDARCEAPLQDARCEAPLQDAHCAVPLQVAHSGTPLQDAHSETPDAVKVSGDDQNSIGNNWEVLPCAMGSQSACQMSLGVESEHWMCSEIVIPPGSYSPAERLKDGQAALVCIANAVPGACRAMVGDAIVLLSTGDHLLIRANEEYCLRNDSPEANVCVKLILILQPGFAG